MDKLDAEYAAIARARIEYALTNPTDKKPDKKLDKIADNIPANSMELELEPFVFPDGLDAINPQPPKPVQQKLF